MSFKDQIDLTKVPLHVAIIMDGNGRWAQQKGKERVFGHISGVDSVRESLTAAGEIGVKYLTLYAFSTENWNRPKEEVDALMNLLVKTIASEVDALNENSVKLQAVGDVDNLPESCQEALAEAIENTKNNTRVTLNLALSYSSKWEITKAIQQIANEVKEKNILPSEINEELISSYLGTGNIPDPELLIRTSGETRISNFMLWQLAYAELFFLKKLWPDFTSRDLQAVIKRYKKSKRNFGAL